jgi:predicted Rdx family selenoprotein
MTDVVMVKQRIEEGKVDRLTEWMAEVRDRSDEAEATLRDEGMLTESAFLEHTDDGPHLVYYMEAEDIGRVWEQYEDSDHDIDREHKQVMREVLEDGRDVGEFEPLYHLTNPDR